MLVLYPGLHLRPIAASSAYVPPSQRPAPPPGAAEGPAKDPPSAEGANNARRQSTGGGDRRSVSPGNFPPSQHHPAAALRSATASGSPAGAAVGPRASPPPHLPPQHPPSVIQGGRPQLGSAGPWPAVGGVPEAWLTEVKALFTTQQQQMEATLAEWADTLADRITQVGGNRAEKTGTNYGAEGGRDSRVRHCVTACIAEVWAVLISYITHSPISPTIFHTYRLSSAKCRPRRLK